MRFKQHYWILLVFFLVAVSLKFSSFTGLQTANYVEVGIDGISTFVFKDPLSWKSTDPLSFEVHFSNQGTIATINPVVMTVQLYDMHTGLIVALPQSNSIGSLNQGQFQKFNFDFGILSPKEYMLILDLDNVDDTTPHNNRLMQQVIVSAPMGPVQIPNPPTSTTPPTPTTLGPDPRVKDLVFAGIDPLNLKTNQYVGFDVLVENLGTTTTNPVYVTAQIKQGLTLINQDLVTIPRIDVGRIERATFLLNPLNYGSYMLTITVDNIGDVNTANNVKQQRLEVPSGVVIPAVQIPNPPPTQLTGADLIVESIQINQFPSNQLPLNQAFTAEISVLNQGGLDTSAGFDIDYAVFSSSTGIKFSSGVVAQPKRISKGAREKSTINLAGLPAGYYNLRVTADFKGTSGDINLANNEKVLNLIVPQPSASTVCNNNGYCDHFAGEGSACSDCTAILSDCQTKYDGNEVMALGTSKTFTSQAGYSSLVEMLDIDNTAKTALYAFNTVKKTTPRHTSGIFTGGGEVLVVDVGTLYNRNYAFVCVKAAQQTCNNNDVCDGNIGEDQTNCPNDCDLGTNQVFCNSADFKDVLFLAAPKTTFADTSSNNHDIQLASIDLSTKRSKLIYDLSSITLDLKTAQSTADYEMLVPVVGKDPQGKEFAVACVKVKTTTTPPVIPPVVPLPVVCNNNGICERHLNENLNNCPIDCSASQANLQFCAAGTSDFQDRISVTELRKFADSFQQVHTVKLTSVDKGSVQASVEYDGNKLTLDKGIAQQTNNYEIVVPFFYEELHPSIPQMKVLSAAVCVKQKTKTTTTPPGIITTPGTGITPGTGTTTRPGTGIKPLTPGLTQFYDITMLVKDKTTSKPLKDAKINFYLYIKVTDDAGKAEFKSVPKELIKYKVVKQGYKSLEGEINIDKSQQVNFELEPGMEITSPAAKGVIQEAQLIFGQYADPADVFTAELLKKTLSNNIVVEKDGSSVLQLGVIPSDQKIDMMVALDNRANLFVPNTHSILVGGACVNQQTSVMLDNPPVCDSDVTPGQARIKLKTLHGGKNIILLVYGYTKEDTRLAAQALIRGLKETQTGTDFVITQKLGEIQVQKLG